MKEAVGIFGCLIALVAGLAQLAGCYALLSYWGWHPAAAVVVMIVLIYLGLTPLVVVGCFFGALLEWEWPWWGAALLAFPGIVFVIVTMPFTLLSSFGKASRSRLHSEWQ